MRVANYGGERARSIPLTVIDGLRGAGKSALLRHAMRASNGRRVAAVVRDLEPLVADSNDVQRNGSVAQWPNGSMSITTDDPTATLALLARRADPPDHVLVEADGTSNPRRLGGYGYMPGYRPDGLITVVDATTAMQTDRDPQTESTWLASLRLSDVIVLNKADLAGRATTTTAQRLIESIAPQARFVWCVDGHVALPLLLGATTVPEDRTIVAEWQSEYPTMRADGNNLVGEYCRCWCFLGDKPISWREFQSWVGHLPPFIVRADGSVYLEREPQHRHEFSLIGTRWMLSRGAPWADGVPSTRITIVGTDGSRGESARRIRRSAETPLDPAMPELSQ